MIRDRSPWLGQSKDSSLFINVSIIKMNENIQKCKKGLKVTKYFDGQIFINDKTFLAHSLWSNLGGPLGVAWFIYNESIMYSSFNFQNLVSCSSFFRSVVLLQFSCSFPRLFRIKYICKAWKLTGAHFSKSFWRFGECARCQS